MSSSWVTYLGFGEWCFRSLLRCSNLLKKGCFFFGGGVRVLGVGSLTLEMGVPISNAGRERELKTLHYSCCLRLCRNAQPQKQTAQHDCLRGMFLKLHGASHYESNHIRFQGLWRPLSTLKPCKSRMEEELYNPHQTQSNPEPKALNPTPPRSHSPTRMPCARRHREAPAHPKRWKNFAPGWWPARQARAEGFRKMPLTVTAS